MDYRCVIAIAAALGACGGPQPATDAPAIASDPPTALFCALDRASPEAAYTITYAHPPSPTASTDLAASVGSETIRWSQEYRGDEGRVSSTAELVCNGPGVAIRSFAAGGETWTFDPPLTVLVADSAEGTTEGAVHVSDGAAERSHTCVFAWLSERHVIGAGEIAGLAGEYAITMRSVLYLDDQPDPAQQTETTWVVGDGLAVVRDRHAWHVDGERIDAASRLQRAP